jgi:myo-inositol-1(or 4)-monophosphatase
VDIVVESGLNPWDIRALEPIIINAGGILKTWDNKKILNGGRIIACSNKKIFNICRIILDKKNPPKNKSKMG